MADEEWLPPKIQPKLSLAVTWARDHRDFIPCDEMERLVSQYEHVRADVQHDDERRWTLFGAFLVAESLLATTLATDIHRWIISVLGILSTILMGVAIWRNNTYLRDRSMVATVLEELVGPRTPAVRFYDKRAQLPDQRLLWQEAYGLLRDEKEWIADRFAKHVTAWLVMRITLEGTAATWGLLFTSSLGAPGWLVLVMGVLLGAAIAWDAGAEIKQKVHRAKKRATREGPPPVREKHRK